MSTPLLAAALIVRDEATHLPACLASLRGLTDEIHVYDTGSADGTPEIAAALGATVSRGPWADDFAAARNACAAAASATWLLALDADHRIAADPAGLRELLTGTDAVALRVEVDDRHHASPYRQTETRLYRPAATSWRGRVHERLSRPATAVVPADLLELRHLGHVTRDDLLRRAERHVLLGRLMLDELAPGDRAEIARTLVGLGRDCVAAERWQQATDTYETVRELFGGTPEWTWATDGLARLMLANGYDKVCLLLVRQLREAGADAAYCDWLEAQAMAQLGHPEDAALLLAGVAEIVDTAGRRRDPAALRELRGLVGRLRHLVNT